MAINAFKSESKTIEVILKDSEGEVVDPSLSTIHDIEIIIQNRYDGSVLAKYSRELKAGWTQAETTSTNMILRISPAMLNGSQTGLYKVQHNIILADGDMPGGVSISTNEGILLAVTEAYTE